MVHINPEDFRVACVDANLAECDTNSSCNKCDSMDTEPIRYSGERQSKNSKSVSYNMLRDKVSIAGKRKRSKEQSLREEAARWVGYDPVRYSKPFKGRSRDLKAVITAVRFKQVLMKHSSGPRCLMKEAILTNTMRRAEDDLLIRARGRQLRRAQAVAEARALKERNSCSNQKTDDVSEFMDDALQSLDLFMQSLSSASSPRSVDQ